MSAIHTTAHHFEPGLLSIQELNFLLDHLEEPPNAALHGSVPVGVNPSQIQKTLAEFQELDQLEKFRGVKWAGFEALRDSITRFLDWHARNLDIYRVTGGPTNPNGAIHNASHFSFSEDGGAFKYAIGADSGELARTEILDDGSRKPFTVKLLVSDGPAQREELASVAPWIARTKSTRIAVKDVVDVTAGKTNGTIRCSICDKTEVFDPRNRSSRTMARTRMGRHLKNAKADINRHLALYRKEFESPSARV